MVQYDKKNCKIEYHRIPRPDGKKMKIMIVRPENTNTEIQATGVLWLHGGGYFLGFPEMLFMSCAAELVRKCNAVIVSPAYRLSIWAPYPAALEDSYLALQYMKEHAKELGIRENQIMVGGESAGGGLAAALCLYARDKKEISIAFQMPLYPMLDCEDTDSSRDNHEKIWNTRRNHLAWKLYLRSCGKGKIPIYASPSRCETYEGLPPAYSFVGDIEPFYCETLTYIQNLKQAGIHAEVDIYPGKYHAFNMMEPDSDAAQQAAARLCKVFCYAAENYFCE